MQLLWSCMLIAAIEDELLCPGIWESDLILTALKKNRIALSAFLKMFEF